MSKLQTYIDIDMYAKRTHERPGPPVYMYEWARFHVPPVTTASMRGVTVSVMPVAVSVLRAPPGSRHYDAVPESSS